MASDKEQMMSSANYYAGLVASAKNACSEAKTLLTSAQSTVQGSWKGESGDAMAQALSDVQSELNCISEQLSSLEDKMRNQATNIYNSWAENDEEAQ